MCIRCGQKVENESGVALGYIHKNLRLADDEIARLGDKDLKNLLRHKKLYLVLDLDHTLLNSARLADISAEELYLKDQREVLPGYPYCLGLLA
uniref:protein-serine/threonine phosphatase n=1 Tax=Nicotiana tabacum TaxID=4097 RepID=A0A1S4ARB2_TOBAC|nr:PREDICTED: RNA polymerase II C-terminal domain phosphatase-like 4 isoform X2 [Nicotiana tabacum]